MVKLFLFKMPRGYAVVAAENATRAAQWLDDEWAPPEGEPIRLDLEMRACDEPLGVYFEPTKNDPSHAAEIGGNGPLEDAMIEMGCKIFDNGPIGIVAK